MIKKIHNQPVRVQDNTPSIPAQGVLAPAELRLPPVPSGVASKADPLLSGAIQRPQNRAFEAILADPAVPGLDPGAQPVPAPVLNFLKSLEPGEKVLVVGHTVPRPDGDSVGSTVALVRALRALGVDAVATTDAELPGKLRKIAAPGELLRPDQLTQKFSKVILSDVASAEQIGGAARFLSDAQAVMVLDHHVVAPDHQSLGLAPETPLVTWVDPGQDSAAQMVGTVLRQLLTDQVWAQKGGDLSLPLLVGILTDVSFGRGPMVAPETLPVVKFLLQTYQGGQLEKVDSLLDYQVPTSAVRALTRPFEAEKIWGRPVQVQTLSGREFQRALAAGQKEDPGLVAADLIGPLMEALDKTAFSSPGRPQSWVTALIYQESPGDSFSISLRSPLEGVAAKVAARLGGGGKGHSAGARHRGDLVETRAALRQAIEQTLALETQRLGNAGSPG